MTESRSLNGISVEQIDSLDTIVQAMYCKYRQCIIAIIAENEGKINVSEITKKLSLALGRDIRSNVVSNHLKALEGAGCLTFTRDRTVIYYRFSENYEKIKAIMEIAESIKPLRKKFTLKRKQNVNAAA